VTKVGRLRKRCDDPAARDPQYLWNEARQHLNHTGGPSQIARLSTRSDAPIVLRHKLIRHRDVLLAVRGEGRTGGRLPATSGMPNRCKELIREDDPNSALQPGQIIRGLTQGAIRHRDSSSRYIWTQSCYQPVSSGLFYG
jgi:hypothetical protein